MNDFLALCATWMDSFVLVVTEMCILLYWLWPRRRALKPWLMAMCILSGLFILLARQYLVSAVSNQYWRFICTYISYLPFILFFSHTDFLTGISICAIGFIVMDLSEISCFLGGLHFTGIEYKFAAQLSIGSLVYYLSIICLRWILAYLIKRFGNIHKLKIRDVKSLIFILIPLIPYVITRRIQELLGISRDLVGVKILSVNWPCCLCALIIMLGHESYLRYSEQTRELARLNDRMRSQQEQFSLRKDAMEKMDARYHDMKHMFLSIESMQSVGEIHDYVRRSREDMRPIEVLRFSGNDTIDIILAEKTQECDKLHIRLTPYVDAQDFGFMDPADIATIFGNALDNAVEACAQVQDPALRRINVKVCTQKSFVVAKFQNYFVYSLRKGEELYMTTKADVENHGFGLRNIKAAVDKYSGEMNITATDNEFVLTVLLPIGQNAAGV